MRIKYKEAPLKVREEVEGFLRRGELEQAPADAFVDLINFLIRYIPTRQEINPSELDRIILTKIAKHKEKYKSFKDREFKQWLYCSYLNRQTNAESERIKQYVAYKATIPKLNRTKRVGESIARYASLPHT